MRSPRQVDAGSPIFAVWELTLRCDLGCRHCGSRAGPARAAELDTTEALNVVEQLVESGVREVTLIGGEAYLRADWDVIARAIVDRGMVCTMTTGARDLDERRVRRAEDAGIASIAVSIDGLERTHDAQRGVKGSWRAAVDACRRIAASRVRLTTNTQINALSGPELPAIARLMAELGSAAWQVQLTVAMGRAVDRPRILLEPHQLLEVFPLLVWIRETILDPDGIALVPGNNIGYFGPFEELVRYGGRLGNHWVGCGAGTTTLGIEANGDLKGCPSLPSVSYVGGNLRETPLRELIARAEPIQRIGRRSLDSLWGRCRSCRYAAVCMAGCTWTSHSLLGRPGNNPYCIHRALELERAGIRERIEKTGDAPGTPFDIGAFRLVEEPIPADTGQVRHLLGIPLAEVVGATPATPSLWDDAVLRDRVQPQRLAVLQPN